MNSINEKFTYLSIYLYVYIHTRYDGRDNTKKPCDFISIAVPQKDFFVRDWFFTMAGLI